MAPARKKQKVLPEGAGIAASGETDETALQISEVKPEISEKTEQHRRSLFVRSLPASTTTESLTELFSESYPIKHATAVVDPATKQCRGYGFVTFADAEDAHRAKAEFNGRVIDDRKLRVEVAEPRNRDAETAPTVNPVKEAKAKRELERAEAQQQPKLIVRNLPWSIKNSVLLANLFVSYGKVKHADVPKKAGGLLAGFGFVTMRGKSNAEKAIAGVNGKEVEGRVLAVDWAVNKEVWDDMVDNELEQDSKAEVNGAADAVAAAGDDFAGLPGDSAALDGTSDYDNTDGIDERSSDVEVTVDGDRLADRTEDRSTTLFVRNLPFTCTDEELEDRFSAFGSTRYARVVLDTNTERSKGTGFVCFYSQGDAETCLKEAPRYTANRITERKAADGNAVAAPHSILQNEETDPSGRYTMDGRVLQVTRAVDKSEASRLTQEGVAGRNHRDRDKRRLYLLSEGTISTNTALYEKLSPSERTTREASAKQRKILIESNPTLHLSLTRLSIRNIPRSVTSKELKALAREAVVGFATDVKQGKRHKLSYEELRRGSEEMVQAEKSRRTAGKGIVKQAKVVFEGREGTQVNEESGAGRSRGYGFIEFYTHRSALMGLRWMNGHLVEYSVGQKSKGKAPREDVQDRKKRLIVEFAIENAQVVNRRRDREVRDREKGRLPRSDAAQAADDGTEQARAHGTEQARAHGTEQARARTKDSRKPGNPDSKSGKVTPGSHKRRRDGDPAELRKDAASVKSKLVDEKLARRQNIIARKRSLRRTRKKA